MKPTRSLYVLLAVSMILIASPALAENWPQWRGAKHDGISNEKGLPSVFGKSKNVLWRLSLPGSAGATPAVWDGRIFLTSADEDGQGLLLLCVSTDGKELWRRTVSSGNRTVRMDEGNSASPSPSTDGKLVWASMSGGDLACFDVSGKPVWKINLQDRYGKFQIMFGLTSTPLLDGERLYLQLIHGEGKTETREARVVALEKATGKEIWQQQRHTDAVGIENEHSYASPTIYRDGEREFLITHGADYVMAHELDTGKEIWRCGGLNGEAGPGSAGYNRTLRIVASPLAVPGLIVVPSAKHGPVLGLRPDGRGDITNASQHHAWRRSRDTPDVPSPLVHEGLVYLCRENGNLICLDAKTGQEYYNERTHRMRHRASPVYVDGKILLTARDGTISVVKPGREFKLLAQNKMTEDMSASPAIAGGRMYLRTFEALYAVGEK